MSARCPSLQCLPCPPFPLTTNPPPSLHLGPESSLRVAPYLQPCRLPSRAPAPGRRWTAGDGARAGAGPGRAVPGDSSRVPGGPRLAPPRRRWRALLRMTRRCRCPCRPDYRASVLACERSSAAPSAGSDCFVFCCCTSLLRRHSLCARLAAPRAPLATRASLVLKSAPAVGPVFLPLGDRSRIWGWGSNVFQSV